MEDVRAHQIFGLVIALMFFSPFLSLYTVRAHIVAGRHIIEYENNIYWTSGPSGSLFPWPREPGDQGSTQTGLLVTASEADSFIYTYLIKTWGLIGVSILAWFGTGLFLLESMTRRHSVKVLVRILLVSILVGCLVTICSSRLFVIQTENVHNKLITYEKGVPFPYIIETVEVRLLTWWEYNSKMRPPLYPYEQTVGYEVLAIPLLSSVLSNTVAVAGVIGIILIRAKKSNLRADGFRDQLGRKMAP